MDILVYLCSGVLSAGFSVSGTSMDQSLFMDRQLGTGEPALSCWMPVAPLDGGSVCNDKALIIFPMHLYICLLCKALVKKKVCCNIMLGLSTGE